MLEANSPIHHTRTAVLGGLSASAVAAFVGMGIGGDRLSAAEISQLNLDTDRDGISDGAEIINLTNPMAADSDGDGLSDVEELARGGNPLIGDAGSLPNTLSVGLRGTSDGFWVRTDVAVFVPGGHFTNLEFELGGYLELPGQGGAPEAVRIPFPIELTAGNGTLQFEPSIVSGGVIAHFDLVVPQALFEAFGWLPLYATVGYEGSGVVDADAQTMVFENGIMMSIDPYVPTSGFSSASPGAFAARPMTVQDEIPASMTPDQICVQEASTVGSSGGIVELQIDASDCQPAEFMYCAASCAGEIGTTRNVVDPLQLIGG